MELTLKNKSIIVTGGGSGLGAEIASACARAGASVVVNDINADASRAVAERIHAAGGRALPDASDITSWDAAGALVEKCVDEYGSIDGLVNNAGLLRLGFPHEMTEQDIRDVFEVNVMGTAFCTAHAVRRMRMVRQGSIVNITSGAQCGMKAMGVYGGSKGAVASMTYSWALDLEVDGIRVNALSPLAKTGQGLVQAEYWLKQHGKEVKGTTNRAEDNAPVVCYLLSDHSRGVTGQVVRIEGRKLSLMTHPAVAEPIKVLPDWRLESIAAAFDDGLRDVQHPVGIVVVRQSLAA